MPVVINGNYLCSFFVSESTTIRTLGLHKQTFAFLGPLELTCVQFLSRVVKNQRWLDHIQKRLYLLDDRQCFGIF
jgi:hypothetical protein